MKIILTVDFDFFVREEIEWDWHHSESMSELLWSSRAMGLLLSGIDPESLIQSSPETFFHRLKQRGVSFKNCQVFAVADSHGHGASFYQTIVRQLNGRKSVPLLNFDAHHDLGYHPRETISRWVLRNQVEAGSWVWPLIVGRPTQKYTVVYPDWKGLKELDHTNPPLRKEELARCSFLTESDWFGRPGERLEVLGFLAVRSGAWTPPWLDKSWVRFLEAATMEIGEAPYEWPPNQVHKPSVLDPREWDWTSVKEMAEIQRMFMSGIKQIGSIHAQGDADVQSP